MAPVLGAEAVGIGLNEAIEVLSLRPSQRKRQQLSSLARLLRSQQGFLHGVQQADCESLCRWLAYEFVPAGEEVFREGSVGDQMYIILSGACEVAPSATGTMQPPLPGATELLHVGRAFGQLALINASDLRRRTVTAAAVPGLAPPGGPGPHRQPGVHLATLQRSDLNHMRFLGQSQPEGTRALQAVLSACISDLLLRAPPGSRSAEEVEELAQFLSQLEAFRTLPPDMVQRLAAEAAHVRLPGHTVLFEEDAPGHAMYVVLGGQCDVRARPPAAAGKAGGASRSTSLGRASDVGSGEAAGRGGAAAGGGEGAPQGVSRTGSRASRASSSGARGSGAQRHVPKTQAQIVKAEKEAALTASAPTDGTAAHGSPFWIARFMVDAVKRLSLADGASGLGQEHVTPLAAVAAARWRQVALGKRQGQGQGQGDAGQAEPEQDPGGMEALLGRAAARALRRAVTSNKEAGAHGYDEEQEAPAAQAGPVGSLPDPKAAAGGTVLQQAAEQAEYSASHAPAEAWPVTPAQLMQGVGPRESQFGGSTSAVSAVGSRRHGSPRKGSSAASGDVGGASGGADEPAKRLLRQLGARDPAHVSRALLAELVARADLGVVLYEVAKSLVQRGGGPKGITAKGFHVISNALRQQIKAGPDGLPATLAGHRVLPGGTGGGRGVGALPRARGREQHGEAGDGVSARPSISGAEGFGALDVGVGRGGWRESRPGLPSGPSSTALAEEMQAGGGALSRSNSRRPRASAATGSLWGGPSYGDLDCLDDEDEDGSFEDGNDDGASVLDGSIADWDARSGMTCAAGSAVGSVAGGRLRGAAYEARQELAQARSAGALSAAEMDQQYGPVLRSIGPGGSFGELALLHRAARRTATVVANAAPPFAAPQPPSPTPLAAKHAWGSADGGSLGAPGGGGGGGGGGASGPVELLVITRSTFNRTVRSGQLAQLQGLLRFLAGVAPFRGLNDKQRASLAVFCRRVDVAAGTVLALQGEPQDSLWMVQEGEVVMLDGTQTVAGPLMAPEAAASAGGRKLLRNTSASIAEGGAAGGGGGGGAAPQGGRMLGQRMLSRQLSAPEQQRAAHRRVMFDSGTSSGAAAPAGPTRHVPAGVLLGSTLTCMGPGGVFGEQVLANLQTAAEPAGREDDKEPGSRASRPQRRFPVTNAHPLHPSTVVARRPSRLLVVSARDLARFAEVIAAPLAELCGARTELLHARSGSIASAKESVAERVDDARRILGDLRRALSGGRAELPTHGSIDALAQTHPVLAATLRGELEKEDAVNRATRAMEAIALGPGGTHQIVVGSDGRVKLLSRGGAGARGGGKPPRSDQAPPSAGSKARAGLLPGGGAAAVEPHPLAARLADVLQSGAPVLLPSMRSVSMGHSAAAMCAREQELFLTTGSRSLSTIAEESTQLLVEAVVAAAAAEAEVGVLEAQAAPAGMGGSGAGAGGGGVEASVAGSAVTSTDEEEEDSGLQHLEEPSEDEDNEEEQPRSSKAGVHNTKGELAALGQALSSIRQLLDKAEAAGVVGEGQPAAPAAPTAPAPAVAVVVCTSGASSRRSSGKGERGLHETGARARGVLPPLAPGGSGAASGQVSRQSSTTGRPTAAGSTSTAAATAGPPHTLPPLRRAASETTKLAAAVTAAAASGAAASSPAHAPNAPGGNRRPSTTTTSSAGGGRQFPPILPPLDSPSQASLRSYPSIGPTASVVAAAAAAAAGEYGSGDPYDESNLSNLYDEPEADARYGSAVFSDDGTLSPDLSQVVREGFGARGAAVGAGLGVGVGIVQPRGSCLTGAPSRPSDAHAPRPQHSGNSNHGSIDGSQYPTLSGSSRSHPSPPLGQLPEVASWPHRPRSGSSSRHASHDGTDSAWDEHAPTEGPGASIEVMVGGRLAKPRSRSTSLSGSGAPRGRSTDGSGGRAGLAPALASPRAADGEVGAAGGGAPALRLPGIRAVGQPQPAATGPGSPTGEALGTLPGEDRAGKVWPSLPWGRRSSGTGQSSGASVLGGGQGAAGAGGAQVGVDASGVSNAWAAQPLPVLPALRVPLVGAPEGAGGQGCCSPSAALLAERKGGLFDYDSPVHSPRLMSAVY